MGFLEKIVLNQISQKYVPGGYISLHNNKLQIICCNKASKLRVEKDTDAPIP